MDWCTLLAARSQWFCVVISSDSSVCKNGVLMKWSERKFIISGTLISFSVSSSSYQKSVGGVLRSFWLSATESPHFQEKSTSEQCKGWLNSEVTWPLNGFYFMVLFLQAILCSMSRWAGVVEVQSHTRCPRQTLLFCQRLINVVLWFLPALDHTWSVSTYNFAAFKNARELTASLCMGQIICSKPSYSFLTAVTHIPEYH